MAKNERCRLCCCLFFVIFVVITAVVLLVVLFTKVGCSDGSFKHGAVAADSERCSIIGRDILQQGGSAVDGAIAALLCTSVVNPQSTGLGGGSIFTILDKSGNIKIISSRETVPKLFKHDLLKNCPSHPKLIPGSEWIGVPGEIRGYKQAHDLYGQLPWAKLFEPTIKLARFGFPLPPYLGMLLSSPVMKPLIENSALCDVLCNKNGTVLRHGELLRFPKLAETMETIAEEGADAFYSGSIAHNLIQDIKDAGGTLTLDDLKCFQAKVTHPLVVEIGDYKMYTPPPPAGGAILSFVLNIMKGFNLSPSSITSEHKAVTYHQYVEALKFANGQRRKILDQVFNHEQDVTPFISDEFADRVRAMINNTATYGSQYYNITPFLDSVGTTHVSVLAADGTAVSVTSTINHFFGSMVYSSRTGVILNNELADFCMTQNPMSEGEQPPSSMTPSILYSKSKKKVVIIGGSGGTMITTGVASALMNHLWFGMNLNDAITAPVLFVDSNNKIQAEKGFDDAVVARLNGLGHVVTNAAMFLNVVNAVTREDSCISAVSDTRKQGKAAGY